MQIHVNPLYSDGSWTVGYDDDGLAGQWAGNMAESCNDRDFMASSLGNHFHDGNEEYTVEEDQSGALYWEDSDGDSTPVDVVLRNYGAK